jgi:hypothetical protein
MLKIGDKVTIKSRQWYEKEKDCRQIVEVPYQNGTKKLYFNFALSHFCGRTLEIDEVSREGWYKLREQQQDGTYLHVPFCWVDGMFEATGDLQEKIITLAEYNELMKYKAMYMDLYGNLKEIVKTFKLK